jgi:hypothetical protein
MYVGGLISGSVFYGSGANLIGTATGLSIGGNAATVTTNANLTGVVTSVGNVTSIANGAITNAMLANSAVANLSGTNTGDQTNISGNAATATTSTNLYGAGGSYIASSNGGKSYSLSIQVREAGLAGAQASNMVYAPRLAFHWSGVVASSIAMEANGRIGIFNNPGTAYENFVAETIYANSSFQGNLTGNVTGNVSGNSATTSQRTFGNVRTDGINRGSYGAISIAGSNGTYSGIDFADPSVTLMVRNSDGLSGMYKNNNAWIWYFDGSGVLTVGTVPGGSVSGTVASATNATYATTAGSAPANGGTATAAAYLNGAGYIYRGGFSGNWNTDFQNTPSSTYRYYGDNANDANSPGGTWWFSESFRHSNGSNYWGTQVAWGWEDNANRLATRNITANSFGGWVYYLNSSNYSSYALPASGGTLGGNLTINGSSNTPLSVNATEPYMEIVANGGSNTAGLAIKPTTGYDAVIGNFRGGALNMMANSTRAGQFRLDGGYYDLQMGTGGGGINGTVSFYGSNSGAGYEGRLTCLNSDGNTHFYHRNNASGFTDIGYWNSSGMYITYYGSYSDIRLKNVIETNPSITMDGIDVIKYTLKSHPDIVRYGYSAQQVQSVLSDLVTINSPISGSNGDGTLMLNYTDLHVLKIATLERKVQDLQSQIDALKAK